MPIAIEDEQRDIAVCLPDHFDAPCGNLYDLNNAVDPTINVSHPNTSRNFYKGTIGAMMHPYEGVGRNFPSIIGLINFSSRSMV